MSSREMLVGMFGSGVAGFLLALCFMGCSGKQVAPDTIATIANLTPCVLDGVKKGLKDDELVGHVAGCGIEALRMGVKAAEDARDSGTNENEGKRE